MKTNRKALWAPLAWFLAVLGAIAISILEVVVNLASLVGLTIKALAAIAVGVTKSFGRKFEYLYAQLRPTGVCAICGKSDGKIKLSPCCNRWVHDSCHERETINNKMADILGKGEFARMASMLSSLDD